jgi:hypothetical protein
MSTSSSASQGALGGPSGPRPAGAERARIEQVIGDGAPWHCWGPYLAERAWGTVREDYSANGDAWGYLPFEQAASRAYRWSEDGMGGICDQDQLICLALALWNGQDPILKERLFGLTNAQGNHGEDAKECWWYLDATPTSSWLVWRYHYPQARFPYEELVAENARRTRNDPEYELVDTGVFSAGRYFTVTATWAKASPEDILWVIEATNMADEPAPIDVLPTVWFRNRWSWQPGAPKPSVSPCAGAGAAGSAAPGTGAAACLSITCEPKGSFVLVGGFGTCGQGQPKAAPELLFTDNETNAAKLWGAGGPKYAKDAIADYVVHRAPAVSPALVGTKAALRYHFEVPPGETARVKLRFGRQGGDLGTGFDEVLAQRKAEADEFYRELTPSSASFEEAKVLRQAAAGMLWCKQFYHYDVKRWLEGDPGQPPPPPERREGRNSRWSHVFNHEVISMPDSWEYPWYAAWDLAFHAVALAHLDPEYAKYQLLLLCKEWYMHPNGQLPAYEWDFGDVNPPVQAWAAMAVWRIDARQRAARGLPPDNEFLEKLFHKLLLNFTWWVNREDAEGNNLFEGGFLGLDNIGLFDRSQGLPVPGVLEQSDGTAWMAMYCVSMLEMALRLCDTDQTYEDIAIKFYEHFAYIAQAVHTCGIWDADDGFFYDVFHFPDGSSLPLKVRSVTGLVPLFAVTTLHPDIASRLPNLMHHIDQFAQARPELAAYTAHTRDAGAGGRLLMSIVDKQALVKVLRYVLDPAELLSPYGVRSLSAHYRDHPFAIDLGGQRCSIDYEPAESTTSMFGGNSNWRGPVWFPVNYLLIEALRRYHRYFGDSLKVECPTGSANYMTLGQVAAELSRRLVSLFLPGTDGRRPSHGANPIVAGTWRDFIWFHEYFHGDNGAGLGASHQTGWTGLVLHLIAEP